MAIDVYELISSRTGSDGNEATQDRKYLLRNSDDEQALKLALRAAAPSSFFQAAGPTTLAVVMKLDSVSLDEQHTDGLWSGSAHYKLKDNSDPDTGDMVFTFDTTGGTQHITQSIATKHKYPSTAPDLGGAIGVTGDSVEGVDITVPTYAFSETHYLPDAMVSDAYKGKLFKLTGTVCNAAFKGGQAGEILFLGATGSKRGQGDWEVTFKFAASPNVTGLTIGTLTAIEKKGWEYVWVRYVTKEVGTGADKMITQTPKAVYVEQVYYDGSFGDLGIGS